MVVNTAAPNDIVKLENYTDSIHYSHRLIAPVDEESKDMLEGENAHIKLGWSGEIHKVQAVSFTEKNGCEFIAIIDYEPFASAVEDA